MKNIAIIPARSGSKGVPDKNIRQLNGKPLMAYSIKAALDSDMFDTVMVSTDSNEYGSIAKDYGADVPFLRSEMTSTDTASSWDTVDEVLNRYEDMGKRFDSVCLLQPTSPFRSSKDIIEAYKLFKVKDAVAVVSVTELEHPLEWCGFIDNSQSLDGFQVSGIAQRRQDTAKGYRPNGAIYIVSINEFRRNRFLYRSGSYAYIMPNDRSVDIDSEWDFRFAEWLIKEQYGQK